MSTSFLICIFLLACTSLAGPQQTSTFTSQFSGLRLVFPGCASQCIQQFISSSFPRCNQSEERESIDCLCRGRGSGGFTLGEGAVKCLFSSCSLARATEEAASAYEVCSDVANAAIPTHTVLSASIVEPTTVALTVGPSSTRTQGTTMSTSTVKSSVTPSSRRSAASTRSVILDTDTSSPSATQRPTFTDTLDILPSTTASSTATSSAGSTATAAESTSALPEPILTTGQIAGISVGGGVIGIAAVGLLAFIFCFKRKGRRRRDSDTSFGTPEEQGHQNDPRGPFISATTAANMHNQETPSTRPLVGAPGGPADKRWTLWTYAKTRQQTPTQREPSDIGLAISSVRARHLTHESSPASFQSYHTTSRLLPDKPIFKKSTPPRPTQFGPPTRMEEATVVNMSAAPGLRLITPTPPPKDPAKHVLRNWNEENTSQPALQNAPPRSFPQLRHQLSDPFIEHEPQNNRSMLYASERQKASVKDLPRINTQTQQQGPPIYNSMTKPAITPPHPPRHLASLVPPPLNPTPTAQTQPSPLLPSPFFHSTRQEPREVKNGRSTQDTRGAAVADDRSLLPSQSNGQFNKYQPLGAWQKPQSVRPETYYSDTSFESDCEEPQFGHNPRQSTLSPVVESPAPSHNTPLSNIRYPRVPGSSAERAAHNTITAPGGSSSNTIYKVSPISPQASPSPEARRPQRHRAYQQPSQTIMELPERSSYQKSPQLPQAPVSPQTNVDGTKWQILASPGLDGTLEISGSPTVNKSYNRHAFNRPSPKTPPQYRQSRRFHNMSRGDYIEQ